MLLLEVGPKDNNLRIRNPTGFCKLLARKKYNLGFETEPEEGNGNRPTAAPRGKPIDYDTWTNFGNLG